MNPLTGTDIGVMVFGVGYLLGKIADFIIKVRNGKGNKGVPAGTDLQQKILEKINKLDDSHHGHQKKDGLYNWQFPESFAEDSMEALNYIKRSVETTREAK